MELEESQNFAAIDDLQNLTPEVLEEVLIGDLPQKCQLECSIAKLAIGRAAKAGLENSNIRMRIANCDASGHTVGKCSTIKRVCAHEGSGDTEDFSEQVENLYEYLKND
jgi:hypothetical protein